MEKIDYGKIERWKISVRLMKQNGTIPFLAGCTVYSVQYQLAAIDEKNAVWMNVSMWEINILEKY